MKLLIFDLHAALAHFRRPDTTSTHATYPFIPRTALRGLLASVMGLEMWPEEGWTGLELLRPVQTRVQQLSLLGKGFLESGTMFNRPTTVELIVNPSYRVYYTGTMVEELADRIARRQATYHTYLGSAFALSVPEFVDLVDTEIIASTDFSDPVPVKGIVPAHCIRNFVPEGSRRFARAGGMLYQALPGRRFHGSINFIYEALNQPFRIEVQDTKEPGPVYFAQPDESVPYIALW
ncbi:CRISPR-associated protein Cas5 [Sulfobacillus thermosulfidooxidans]|uniref:CRISPR-associated protein Cas5 n=1 Tax=Sulfobacillus thermosulfidooxidans TaxID=28034 RepID=UPI0006B53AF6|nr:CRISPR-associated protein Cas5 [Sulfobacillus thermosulfidooxidans]